MLEGLFAAYPYWVRATLAAVTVLAVSYALSEVVSRLLASIVHRVNKHVEGDIAQRRATRGALRLVRLILTVLLAVVLIFPAMSIVGIRSRVGLTPERLLEWVVGSGLRIGLIVLLSWLIVHVVTLVVARIEAGIGTAVSVDVIERAKRARTLGTLVQTTVYAIVSSVALLMVLRELHIDITPILTGAGIVGLAVGFGAQSLVKDIISGFFLILEDQIRVGDVANIDGTGGLVERITLRTIILRDETGTVHVIPNGSIQRLSNLTKDFSYYVTSVAVSYREDTDLVTNVLVGVAEEMLTDPEFAPFMLGPLEVLGVDRFAESTVDVKVRLKAVPSKQWVIGREFLRRAKKGLEATGVELPAPQRRVLPSVAPATTDQASTAQPSDSSGVPEA